MSFRNSETMQAGDNHLLSSPTFSNAAAASLMSDPVFYIPKIPPNLSTISPPHPPKKLPSIGYDMKTLRKQVEYLYTV